MNKDLFDAIDDANYDKVKALLEKGINVNTKDSVGWTALTLAAYKGDLAIVELLLKSGANINTKNFFGTAVTIAQSQGHTEIVELLKL